MILLLACTSGHDTDTGVHDHGPIGAVTAKPGIDDTFQPGDHGSTFAGSPLACASALAAAKADAGKDVRTEASMIKVFATEMATRVIDHAIQAFGAMGVTQELPLSWLAQKVRTMRVYEGPSEVHRMVIARRVLGGR